MNWLLVASVAALLPAAALEVGRPALPRSRICRASIRAQEDAPAPEDDPFHDDADWEASIDATSGASLESRKKSGGVPAFVAHEGPFSTSWGVPDESTGPRPNFLLPTDWHVSASYSEEEKADMEEERKEALQAMLATIELPPETGDPEEEKEETVNYMVLEEGEWDKAELRARVKAKVPMPTSWQEYQRLQGQLDELLVAEPKPTKAMAAEGERLQGALEEFYPTFKDILLCAAPLPLVPTGVCPAPAAVRRSHAARRPPQLRMGLRLPSRRRGGGDVRAENEEARREARGGRHVCRRRRCVSGVDARSASRV